jgi:hypothetical protein
VSCQHRAPDLVRGPAAPPLSKTSVFASLAGTIYSMTERRNCHRETIDLFFNKFLNGHPYLCRTIDVSPKGILAVTYTEPDTQADSFPVELRLPNSKESLWLWAKTVRWTGRHQAMRFVRMGRRDRAILNAELSARVGATPCRQSRPVS